MELTPDHLMVSPCNKVSAQSPEDGRYTVKSLSSAYVANTKCIDAHKKLLEQQRQYKKQIEEKYGK